MAGNVSFGDEEEFAQTEALAGRMLEDIATQHLAVGETVSRIRYTSPNWSQRNLVVENLVIEFNNGFSITAPKAVLDLRSAPDGFREALRAENERQRPTPPSSPARAEGERLQARPGPKLDPLTGDPIVDESDGLTDHPELDHELDSGDLDAELDAQGFNPVGDVDDFPIGPPGLNGTDITEDV